MKITTTKGELDRALQIATLATGSGDDDKIATHYLIRMYNGKIQVLATNGQRLVAWATVTGAVVEEMTDGDSFTVPGWRVRNLIGFFKDDDAITIIHAGGSTEFVGEKRKGSGNKFGSLAPKDFLTWDGTFGEAQVAGTIVAARLSRYLTFVRDFISENETRSPSLVAPAVVDGVLRATDSVSVALVASDALQKVSLRVHRKDIAALVSFLSLVGTGDVEVREHDRIMFASFNDGADGIGISRWAHPFPKMKLDRDAPFQCWFTVDVSDLTDGIRYLSTFAKKDDNRLTFRYTDNRLTLEMRNAFSGGKPASQDVPLVEQEGMDRLQAERGMDWFEVDARYVQAVAAACTGKQLKLGLNWVGKNGYISSRFQEDGDSFYAVVTWVKQKD